jgi:predicted acylesterase/phospholipase RssA
MADITTQPEPPATVGDMLLTERETMKARRRHIGGAGAAEPNAHEPVGLALSGGGIRSATFSLGVLQELHARGLLTACDYLSTVSGGGYGGGWWSALHARR